jgi:hypothetical protein
MDLMGIPRGFGCLKGGLFEKGCVFYSLGDGAMPYEQLAHLLALLRIMGADELNSLGRKMLLAEELWLVLEVNAGMASSRVSLTGDVGLPMATYEEFCDAVIKSVKP